MLSCKETTRTISEGLESPRSLFALARVSTAVRREPREDEGRAPQEGRLTHPACPDAARRAFVQAPEIHGVALRIRSAPEAV